MEVLTPEQQIWVKRMEAHLRLFGRQNGPVPEPVERGVRKRKAKVKPSQPVFDW